MPRFVPRPWWRWHDRGRQRQRQLQWRGRRRRLPRWWTGRRRQLAPRRLTTVRPSEPRFRRW